MNVHKTVAGVVGAAGLISILAACGSAGNTQAAGEPIVNTAASTTPTSVAAAPSSTAVPAPAVAVKHTSAPQSSTPAGRPASAPSVIGFPAPTKASSTPSHAAPSVPTLTGPVTFAAATVPTSFDCAQVGTSYYTAPNVAVPLDVSVYVTSAQLAQGLTVTAPNNAPRGLSNASRYIGSTSLGHGVWRATYRTFVSLYQPKFTPVTVSSLQATAAGSTYTISFAAPVSIDIANCHS